MFAGEATSPAYRSTLHGARLSGLREAERVWERMKSAERAEGRMEEMLRQVSSLETQQPTPPPQVQKGHRLLSITSILGVAIQLDFLARDTVLTRKPARDAI